MQKPIGSGFNATSTTTDVIKGIDHTGKIAIVTGGDGGLGLEITKTLTSAGATVIVPARDTEKAKQNLEGIANVETETLSLTDPASIDTFAETFLASGRHLTFEDFVVLGALHPDGTPNLEAEAAMKKIQKTKEQGQPPQFGQPLTHNFKTLEVCI